MHDRGDYKSGWQLEKEWNDAQKNKKKFGEREDFTISSEVICCHLLSFVVICCYLLLLEGVAKNVVSII